MPTENERDELARAIRSAVRVGSMGPNSAEIVASGGLVALTPYEADAAADKLLPWLARLLKQARADALEEAVRAATMQLANGSVTGDDIFNEGVQLATDAIRGLKR